MNRTFQLTLSKLHYMCAEKHFQRSFLTKFSKLFYFSRTLREELWSGLSFDVSASAGTIWTNIFFENSIVRSQNQRRNKNSTYRGNDFPFVIYYDGKNSHCKLVPNHSIIETIEGVANSKNSEFTNHELGQFWTISTLHQAKVTEYVLKHFLG